MTIAIIISLSHRNQPLYRVSSALFVNMRDAMQCVLFIFEDFFLLLAFTFLFAFVGEKVQRRRISLYILYVYNEIYMFTNSNGLTHVAFTPQHLPRMCVLYLYARIFHNLLSEVSMFVVLVHINNERKKKYWTLEQ